MYIPLHTTTYVSYMYMYIYIYVLPAAVVQLFLCAWQEVPTITYIISMQIRTYNYKYTPSKLELCNTHPDHDHTPQIIMTNNLHKGLNLVNVPVNVLHLHTYVQYRS